MLDRVMLFALLVISMSSGFNTYLLYKQTVRTDAFFEQMVNKFDDQLDRIETVIVDLNADHIARTEECIGLPKEEVSEVDLRKKELPEEAKKRFEKEFPDEEFHIDLDLR